LGLCQSLLWYSPLHDLPKACTPPDTFHRLCTYMFTCYPGQTFVFTSGSMLNGLMGCVSILIRNTLKIWLNSFGSIFTAEFLALHEALEAVGSLSLGKCLPYWESVLPEYNPRPTVPWFHPPTHHGAMHDLHCNRDFRKTSAWIPGHVFICGNEAADAVARDMAFKVPSYVVSRVWTLRLSSTVVYWQNYNRSGTTSRTTECEMWNQRYSHGGLLVALSAMTRLWWFGWVLATSDTQPSCVCETHTHTHTHPCVLLVMYNSLSDTSW
jgi:hypothetical protein